MAINQKEEYFKDENDTLYKTIKYADGSLESFVFQHGSNKWVSSPIGHLAQAQWNGWKIEKEEADDLIKKQTAQIFRQCLCKEPTCAKCLTLNCEDDNCKIHKISSKIIAKQRVINSIAHKIDEFNKKVKYKFWLRILEWKKIGKMKKDLEFYKNEVERVTNKYQNANR